MRPLTTSCFSNAVSRRSHVRARLAFSRESRVSPEPSSTLSSATSTSSPTATSTSPRSFLNCWTGMTASDLSPALTTTTSGPTSITRPVRIWPGRIRWLARLSSNIWAKLSLMLFSVGHMARCLAGLVPAQGWVDDTTSSVLPDANGKRHRPACADAAPSIHRGKPAPGELEDLVHDLLDGEPRRVEEDGVRRRAQWRHRTAGIAQIPLADLLRKVVDTNGKSLFFQLLMTPSRAFLGARGQVD